MPSPLRRLAVAAAMIAGAACLGLGAGLPGALAHSDRHGHDGHGQARHFAAGEPGDPTKPSRVIEITMNEGAGTMSYTPARIEVRKGEQIRLVLKNDGELRHELVLDSAAGNLEHKAAMEANPDMAHEEPNGLELDPKSKGELLWRFSTAGTFEYACLIPGHYEAGMRGVVVVK